MLTLQSLPPVPGAAPAGSGPTVGHAERPSPGPAPPPLISSQPRKEQRCYDVLGVSRFATPAGIRHAYRRKALTLHPDKPQGQQAGFLSLAEAFEILSDAAQRGAYDRELAVSDSRDGMSAIGSQPVTNACLHRDSVILCLALAEIPSEEWPRHIAELPVSTLKEMHEYLTSSKKGTANLKRKRHETEFNPEDSTLGKPRHLCAANGAGRGYWCAQIQMCGVHIRSFATKHMVQAAESHLALVSLKETFFAKWKENGMADFEDAFRAALAEARAQKMYFPGAMHWFEKKVDMDQGTRWRLTTPCTRDLEGTLRNRGEVLALLNRGASKGTLQAAIERMRDVEKATKAAWEEMRPATEQRLRGFIECELEHRCRNTGYATSKRRRLRGKQSMTHLCVQLPWLSRFAAEQGVSPAELEALLPPLQARLRGVPSLEQCLQRALRNSLFASGQTPAALEDLTPLAMVGHSGVMGKHKAASKPAVALDNVHKEEPQQQTDNEKAQENEESEAAEGSASADGSAGSPSQANRDASPVNRDPSPPVNRDGSPVNRDSSPVARQQPCRSIQPRRGWRDCYSCILHELLAEPEVDRLFGHPVDQEMYPDYLERIAPGQPVDLRLVLRKLDGEDGGYEEVSKCAADLSMVWENAARFNAPGSYVRTIAEQAATMINDLLLGRRGGGRIWSRGPWQGHRSSSRPETRSRSQLSVQFCGDPAVAKAPGDPR